MDLTKLYQKQVSFTEWFESINHPETEAMRKEDNAKRERLELLQQLIQIPFDKATNFSAEEVSANSPQFQRFMQEHGEELCALRLVPENPELPKLRMRGHKIKEVMAWFKEQKIDPKQYRADFVPHVNSTLWSTIFVINQQGIFGEIVKGGHHILTQGFYQDIKPLIFSYNFMHWNIDNNKATNDFEEVTNHLKGIIKRLKVTDPNFQEVLKEKLHAEFMNNYLCGYFETVFTLDHGLWFIDYNRILGKIYADFNLSKENSSLSSPSPSSSSLSSLNDLHSSLSLNTPFLRGIPGSSGKVKGKVRIINDLDNLNNHQFEDGEILVCKMTTPEHLHLMQRSSAIITDQGGILSHAAIVSRELKKPCITRTEKATEKLKDGDLVEVDADNGFVRKL
ncbi:hypothetical protein HYT52_02530 [Candidatus Woesearchaeota archaeon]|nr:hypothetical protein [Candidatus Woesearchaeota archaeon]